MAVSYTGVKLAKAAAVGPLRSSIPSELQNVYQTTFGFWKTMKMASYTTHVSKQCWSWRAEGIIAFEQHARKVLSPGLLVSMYDWIDEYSHGAVLSEEGRQVARDNAVTQSRRLLPRTPRHNTISLYNV